MMAWLAQSPWGQASRDCSRAPSVRSITCSMLAKRAIRARGTPETANSAAGKVVAGGGAGKCAAGVATRKRLLFFLSVESLSTNTRTRHVLDSSDTPTVSATRHTRRVDRSRTNTHDRLRANRGHDSRGRPAQSKSVGAG